MTWQEKARQFLKKGPLTQEQIGILMRMEAKADMKQKPGLPANKGPADHKKRAKVRTDRVRELAAEGLTASLIARKMNLSRTRISEICRENDIPVKRGVGGNPKPVPRK